ncbi:MAG: type VI secretion system tube protein Hcp [Phycisphaeraceae bacterium]|nr:type VI secretion system tube protein Hcp [Phycisphaeraceae bacterium]
MRHAARVFVMAGLIGAAAFVIAGPLNPPAGTVSSTGKTTQEIYDAVQSVNSSVGGAGRGEGVPGADMQAGTIDIPAVSGFPKITAPIVGMTCDLAYTAQTGGGSNGQATLTEFSVLRNLDPGSVSTFRVITAGTHLQTVTVKLTNASGNIEYKLTDAVLTRVTTQLIQRADGTFAQLEKTWFAMSKLDITTPLGVASYSFVSTP